MQNLSSLFGICLKGQAGQRHPTLFAKEEAGMIGEPSARGKCYFWWFSLSVKVQELCVCQQCCVWGQHPVLLFI